MFCSKYGLNRIQEGGDWDGVFKIVSCNWQKGWQHCEQSFTRQLQHCCENSRSKCIVTTQEVQVTNEL